MKRLSLSPANLNKRTMTNQTIKLMAGTSLKKKGKMTKQFSLSLTYNTGHYLLYLNHKISCAVLIFITNEPFTRARS
jgi:hypothetical protein